MKKYILIFLMSFSFFGYGQDVINPYLNYENNNVTDLLDPSSSYNFNNTSLVQNYNGEYEIVLDRYPWGNIGLIDGPVGNKLFDLDNFALSYQIECVSFPFTIDCAFPSLGDPNGGCYGINRNLILPFDSFIEPNNFSFWEYPISNSFISNKLVNKMIFGKPFERIPGLICISDQTNNNSLVSASFGQQGGATIEHSVLPHSVLKHTISIHCGNLTTNTIISSFSFIIDLTRGRMREYPFRSDLPNSINISEHDLLIRPEIIPSPNANYDVNVIANCNYSNPQPGYSCDGIIDLEGSTINYTPFDPASDDNCAYISSNQNANYGDFFCNPLQNGGMHRLPLADYTLTAGSSVRNADGTTLAGYESYQGQSTMSLLYPNPSVHTYTIDKNITLEWINPLEKIIYNPSEVNISASNLRFPSNYTFKTIRGRYPFAKEVDDAANDPFNGGPFSDPTKQDIPVVTNLYKDFHVSSSYDPSNTDHRYASIYHLQSGSKLTIEPCVKIFDATFEINPGSEIEFENWSTNQVNVNRYQLLFNGGIVSKRNESFYFQNRAETDRILNWKAGDFILAGENVDPTTGSLIGPFSIEPDSKVNFIAGNYINLSPGFEVKYEGDFLASIEPVSIPSCAPFKRRNSASIKENIFKSKASIGYFTCSPNPADIKTTLMFEIYEKSNVSLKVFNSLGKELIVVSNSKLLPTGKYTNTLNTETLPPGLYIAKLETESDQKIIKFIKQ
jgi:hypothetical protein